MKGIAHREPRYESISKAFDYIQEVSGPDFKANILFEYFPLGKISAVSPEITAFRRDPTASILALVMWKEDTKENSDRGRSVAHELAELVVAGQQGVSPTQIMGYSNYGKRVLTMSGNVPLLIYVIDPEAVDGKKGSVSDKAKAVFADNYPKLQRIKKRYDPDNIFNKWFPITPA